MRNIRYLSSKWAFVIFVTLFLGCLLLLACNMPLNILDVIIDPIWLLWCVTGPILFIKMGKYIKKKQSSKENHPYHYCPVIS